MSLPDPAQLRILVIGDVYTDRHADLNLVRLGGVFHMARALDALEASYAVAYSCPAYLDQTCKEVLADLRAAAASKIGDVSGAPNVMEIRESTESGDQGYADLLGAQRSVALDRNALDVLLVEFKPTDVLILGGEKFDEIASSLSSCGARIHVDMDHLDESAGKFLSTSTIFASTSGNLFKRSGSDPAALGLVFQDRAVDVGILKENRGGSRAWTRTAGDYECRAPAFPTRTKHSVGVGDCFDAVWVALPHLSAEKRLTFCAYVAAIYASTFSHQEFRVDVSNAIAAIDAIADLAGTVLPWERRNALSVYLAAPDFPDVDTSILDTLEASLRYHNFSPRRPIRENGLGSASMSKAELRDLYFADMALLEQCDILVATVLENDPGTFAELGWFVGRGKPVILFDPFQKVSNLFVRNLAEPVLNTISDVIDSVFAALGNSNDAT